MKRYEQHFRGDWFPSESGDWCKFSDVETEISRLREKIKKQANDIARKNVVIEKLRGDKKALGRKLYNLKREADRELAKKKNERKAKEADK